MKNLALTLIALSFVFISCKKEDVISKSNGCSDFNISMFEKGWNGKQVTVDFLTPSKRAPINYPGIILKDGNGNRIDTVYSYIIDKGSSLPFQVDIPAALQSNCSWRIELIQLHHEDSVICSIDFTQCID